MEVSGFEIRILRRTVRTLPKLAVLGPVKFSTGPYWGWGGMMTINNFLIIPLKPPLAKGDLLPGLGPPAFLSLKLFFAEVSAVGGDKFLSKVVSEGAGAWLN
jgi:hypothetical protein